MAEEKEEVLETQSADGAEVRDTDIVFDCPHCSKTLVIDYRGAGLQISCSECGKDVLVPIPDGMELSSSSRPVATTRRPRRACRDSRRGSCRCRRRLPSCSR